MTVEAVPAPGPITIPSRFSVEDTEYVVEVCRFAEQVGKVDSLQQCFDRLQRFGDNYCGTVFLGRDFAPYSFSFGIRAAGQMKLNGGVIFHGAHDNGGDGSAPTYSVSLEPHDGWSIHT